MEAFGNGERTKPNQPKQKGGNQVAPAPAQILQRDMVLEMLVLGLLRLVGALTPISATHALPGTALRRWRPTCAPRLPSGFNQIWEVQKLFGPNLQIHLHLQQLLWHLILPNGPNEERICGWR